MFNTDSLKAKLSTELSALMSGLESSYLTFAKPSYDNKGYEVSSTRNTIPSVYLDIVKDKNLVVRFSSICSMYFPQPQITDALGIKQDELARNVKGLDYKERSTILKEHSNKLAEKIGLNPQDVTLEISYTFSSPSLSLSIDMTGMIPEKIEGLGELLKISKFTPVPSQHQSVHFAA